MAVVHDLVEAEVGDIPFFETGDRKAAKAGRELAAMDRIAAMLPAPEGELDGLGHGQVVAGGDVDRPNMRNSGGQDAAGEPACLPATEREAHEIWDVEGAGLRHDAANRLRIAQQFRFAAWDQFDRNPHGESVKGAH